MSDNSIIPSMPFMINVWDFLINAKDLRMVSANGDNKFYLTSMENGETWTSDFYTLTLLEEKLKSKSWIIVNYELLI